MNIETFAKDAGVEIIECGEGWGGKLGYTLKDYPNSSVCGFRTANGAYTHWMKDTFGEHTTKALIKLMKTKG